MSLWCRIFGHRWFKFGELRPQDAGSAIGQCGRCGKTLSVRQLDEICQDKGIPPEEVFEQ